MAPSDNLMTLHLLVMLLSALSLIFYLKPSPPILFKGGLSASSTPIGLKELASFWLFSYIGSELSLLLYYNVTFGASSSASLAYASTFFLSSIGVSAGLLTFALYRVLYSGDSPCSLSPRFRLYLFSLCFLISSVCVLYAAVLKDADLGMQSGLGVYLIGRLSLAGFWGMHAGRRIGRARFP